MSVCRITRSGSVLTRLERNDVLIIDAQYIDPHEYSPWLYGNEYPVPHLLTIRSLNKAATFIIRLIVQMNQTEEPVDCLRDIPQHLYEKRRRMWSHRCTEMPPSSAPRQHSGPTMASSEHPYSCKGMDHLVGLLSDGSVLKVGPDMDLFVNSWSYHFDSDVRNWHILKGTLHVRPGNKYYVNHAVRYVSDEICAILRQRVYSMGIQWMSRDKWEAANRPPMEEGPLRCEPIPEKMTSPVDEPPPPVYAPPPSLPQPVDPPVEERRRAQTAAGPENCHPRTVSADTTHPRGAYGGDIDIRARTLIELDLLRTIIQQLPTNRSIINKKLQNMCEDLHDMIIQLQHDRTL